jgi:hypothetical protein
MEDRGTADQSGNQRSITIFDAGQFLCRRVEKRLARGRPCPLEAYGIALEEAGLAITSLREPVPDLDDGRNHMARWMRMPLFLWLKARPLAS